VRTMPLRVGQTQPFAVGILEQHERHALGTGGALDKTMGQVVTGGEVDGCVFARACHEEVLFVQTAYRLRTDFLQTKSLNFDEFRSTLGFPKK
jgi:hypothetical protein